MPRIVIENGPDRGRTYALSPGTTAVAGRDAAAQIPIRDEMASRKHFQVRAVEGRYQLEDLGSKNGVGLNGKRLEKKVVTLAPNDRIQVGETLLTFVGDDPHPLLGRELSGYRIEDRIGRGGMGTVYRALQLSLDRTVAMKILAPHLVENQNFINLFIREARAAGALSHPNLVQVYDVGVQDEIYFYSMEYIPHGSVEDLLNREKQIPIGRTLEIIRDAALGLQYAELKGLVHRDIKPGNLMIGADDIIKIGDLGIARFGEEEGRVSQKDGVSGSPHYIAPEQARGLDIDHRADLYALGVSFYQMLCGQTPYRGSTPREVILAHLKTEPPSLAERAPDAPAPVVELVEAMMKKDRDERVPSATAVLERLEPLLRRYRDGGSGTYTPSGGGNRWKWAVGLVLLCAVSIGATLAFLQHRKEAEERAEQLRAWTEELDAAERARDAEQPSQVLTAVDGLRAAALPDELAARRDALGRWYEEFRDREERAARDAMRANDFAAEETRIAALDDEAAAAAWAAFAKKYAGTPEATEATRRKDTLVESMRERANRARRAELLVGPVIGTAESYSRSGDFVRAIETLQGVDATAIAGTPAEETLSTVLQRIRGEARSAFDRLADDVRAAIAAARFDEARLDLRRFRAPAFLADDLTALSEEIAAAEQAHEDEGAADVVDVLAVALAEALPIWARLDIGTPGANSQREALQLLGSDLRSRLDDTDRARLQAIVDTMNDLPDFIDAAGKKILDDSARVTLRYTDGSTREVRISEFSARRIIAIPVGERHGTYVDWSELEPSCRLEVVRTSADLPHARLALYGWFAHALGDPDLAEQIWGAAESSAPEVVAALRDAARRVAAE